MADRSAQAFTETVLAPTYYPPTSGGTGDRVRPGNVLHVKNANAAPTVITMVTPGTVDRDLAIADRSRTVPNGTEGFLVIPKDQAYRDADGMVQITWSVTASVTFAVLSRN
jgi:hypothetical protein